LQPKMDALAAALNDEQKGTRAALIRFGVTLTTEQRDAYTRAVRESIEAEHEVRHKDGPAAMGHALALTAEQKKPHMTAVKATRREPLSLPPAAPLVRPIDFLERTARSLTPQQRATAVAVLRRTATADNNQVP